MEIRVDSLLGFQKDISSLLGEDFVREQLSKSTIGMKKGKADLVAAKAHPISAWLMTFEREAEHSRKIGSLRLSDMSLFLLDLYYSLTRIAPLPNSDRIIDRLKQKDHFFSAVFEAKVVRGYLDRGYEIGISDESSGSKCPDFYIKSEKGKVYIEAKSLEDFSLSEKRHWNSLIDRVSKALTKSKRSWKVTIFAFASVDAGLIDDLYNYVLRLIKNGELGSFITGDKVFRIELSEINPWGHMRSGPIRFDESTSELRLCQATSWIDKYGVQWYKDPIDLEFFPLIDTNRSKSILNCINKAKKQIPSDESSLVHVELPHKNGMHLQEVADNAFDEVLSFINSSRINGVHLSGMEINRNPLPGEDIVIHPSFYIPNMNPRNCFPEGFSLSIPGQVELPDIGPEGHIYFVMQPFSKLEKQSGRVIVQSFSDDGRTQLRIWQTYKGVLRADILSPTITRKFIECNIDHKVEENVNMVIDISWRPKEMTLGVNKDILARKQT